MVESLGQKCKRYAKVVGIALVAVIAALIEIALGKRKAEKDGEQIGRLEDEKDHITEAEKKGDDVAVLDEFRRIRKERGGK